MSTRSSPAPSLPTALCALVPLAASLFLALALCSCAPTGENGPIVPGTPPGPAWFEDVTDAVGLDFVHDAGPTGTYFTPQSMGSGCACFDFDGDGLVDIYLLHLGGPNGKKNQL